MQRKETEQTHARIRFRKAGARGSFNILSERRGRSDGGRFPRVARRLQSDAGASRFGALEAMEKNGAS